MIVDAHDLPAGAALDPDLCSVGGDTAGITLARELIDAPFRVCVFESGGREPDLDTQAL